MPPPQNILPIDPSFSSVDEYIDSLIAFSRNELIQRFVGGVHILDFFTRDAPNDLYSRVLPEEWRTYFAEIDIEDILDILMRKSLDKIDINGSKCPESLRHFIREVRRHSLVRDFEQKFPDLESGKRKDPNGIEVNFRAMVSGMKPKKVHEVENFAHYVSNLTKEISDSYGVDITHLVDFGSGQGYLPRILGSRLYGHNVVGIESREDNIKMAKQMDANVFSKDRKRVKAYRETGQISEAQEKAALSRLHGSLQYVHKRIENGDLSDVVTAIKSHPNPSDSENDQNYTDPSLMIISLHSCGNLIHHALSSLLLNPSVRACAIIGCCYNLMAEKQGTTFKPPFREYSHPRLISCAEAADPHGFPLSKRLEEEHITLNITARMMACQAPYNWTRETSEGFFSRHYYRALLQRVLLDTNVIQPPSHEQSGTQPLVIGSLRKSAYASFPAYASAAGAKVSELLGRPVEITPELAAEYDARFVTRRKELCVLWSLMAWTAAVVESLIVVDRVLFLRERLGGKGKVWVETVFEYEYSPRNLVIVGVREE